MKNQVNHQMIKQTQDNHQMIKEVRVRVCMKGIQA